MTDNNIDHTDRNEKQSTNWWQLLFIPLFFFFGWWSRGMTEEQNNGVESRVQGIEESASENPRIPEVDNPTDEPGMNTPNMPVDDNVLRGNPEVPGAPNPTTN